ncbi:DUF4269 domain-containing protein [Chryseolinea sp. T2]|uniref:DUF4269 domain-containing protein n=1 Tax=Chryseolinea sp. T2 TaxID=3129255 RepID=UPI003077B53D
MYIDFTSLDYLKNGTDRQRLAFVTLTENEVLTKLREYDPLLVGTIPINIDIENSDLDIICYVQNSNEFSEKVRSCFGIYEGFELNESADNNAVIARLRINDFMIEVFGQNTPTRQQHAFRHMTIEYKLLCERGEAFRQRIIELKRQGYKTEPAFALVLGLVGNPYLELLKLEK